MISVASKRTIMANIILCIAFILPTIHSANAQDSLKTKRPENHSLYKGSKSLQFRIGNDFSLTNFDGLSFSGKKHYSDKSAIRLGLDVSASITHSESRNQVSNTSSNNYDRQELKLNALYIHYPKPGGIFKFYWGIGPSFGFYRSYRNGWSSSNGLERTKDTESRWSIGGLMALGAEWFANSNLSIHAEYNIFAYYSQYNDTRRTISGDTSTYNKWKSYSGYIEPENVNFGLSVYF
jgi:opacity protein-like surface antigen